MKIDPKRVKEISTIPLSRNKKEIHVFLGRINLVRMFMPNYGENGKDITNMMKREKEVKWIAKAI